MSPYQLTKIATQLAYPLDLGLGLVAVGAVLLLARRVRAGRTLVVAGFLLVYVFSVPLVGARLVNSLQLRVPPVRAEDAPRADAIVLLGGAVTPPAPPLEWMDLNGAVDRIFHAAHLYRAGKAPWIVVSGGGGPHPDAPQKPADVMADVLVELGVPRDALLLERQSRNTWENAVDSRQVLEAHGLRRVLLVTSAVHMPRALAIFRSLGVDAIPAPTDFSGGRPPSPGELMAWLPSADSLRATSIALKEYLGILVYRASGRIRAGTVP
jgi:uncharacterized SAM-binding protein YcdF (DUF218 family)